MLDVFEKYCETKVEPLLQKVKIEVADKFEGLKKLITACENEGMLFSQQVLREVEELKAKEIKDIQNLEMFFTELKEAEGGIMVKIKKNEENVANCSFLLVTLVENAQIDLALLAQDEEVKGNSFIKPMFDPPQKRGVALNSNNVLMPLRPSLPKVPSILYRNKEFQRKDLIEMKEKMLKLSWESTKATIPWKQKEFENLVAEACQNVKAFGDESTFEISNLQNSKEGLPNAISPSFRTRTPNNIRKLRIV